MVDAARISIRTFNWLFKILFLKLIMNWVADVRDRLKVKSIRRHQEVYKYIFL